MGETTFIQGVIETLQDPGADKLVRDLAFQDLICRFQARLTAMARERIRGFPSVGEHAGVDDVLTEVQLRIYRQLRRFDPALDHGQWTGPDGRMHTLHFLRMAGFEVRRALLDLKASLRRVLPTLGLGSGDSGDGDEPAAQLPDHRTRGAVHRDDLEEIHQIVGTLSEELQDVFNLVGTLGLTHEEAASVLRLEVSTSRSRWRQVQLKTRSEILRRRADEEQP